jgi:hypothetical protein
MYVLKDSEKITTKPGMEQAWAEAVGKNQDGYGHGVVDATVKVCAALDAGASPVDAEKACYDLDITGFMAGCMASWVVKFHPRGDEFKAWWNNRHGVPNATGIVNPALVTISTDK